MQREHDLPLRGALAELLGEITPGDLQYSFFINNGTDAVEGAIKLARVYTGRTNFISSIRGFHGKSCGSLSLLGKWEYAPGPETREFNADGTMRATLGGLTSEGTYTADGSNLVVTVDGIPRAYTYTILGGVLTLLDTEFGQAVNYSRVQ